jgi:hypothetical protein
VSILVCVIDINYVILRNYCRLLRKYTYIKRKWIMRVIKIVRDLLQQKRIGEIDVIAIENVCMGKEIAISIIL